MIILCHQLPLLSCTTTPAKTIADLDIDDGSDKRKTRGVTTVVYNDGYLFVLSITMV
jgi:hypothetical protein